MKDLHLLKRKNIGKTKIESYKELMKASGIEQPELIGLEQSDIILERSRIALLESSKRTEIVSVDIDSFIESDLLREVYIKLKPNAEAYIFTDDFEFCGIFLTKAKDAIERILMIAKDNLSHTGFVLDYSSSYFIRVNYYDSTNSDNPDSFDIEISSVL